MGFHNKFSMADCPHSVDRPDGWQQHHIIPLETRRSPGLRQLLHDAARGGFDLDCFIINGILLPATKRDAIVTGLPLHRGGHPRYNRGMIDNLRMIANLTAARSHSQTDSVASDLLSGLAGAMRQRLIGSRGTGRLIFIDEITLRSSHQKISNTLRLLKAKAAEN